MSKLQQGLARYLSQKQLDLLTSTHVGIAGAGGLGSNVAFMLVRSGLRNLTLVDFDQVDSSNLNRQAFFPQDVGKPKTEALAAHLRSLEPDLKLRCLCTRLTKDNAARIFTGCSIVIEALDQAEAKTMLFLALRHLKCFYVGASGLGGWGGPDMVQKQIGPSAVCVGDFKTEVNHKVAPFAPRVMQAAAMQADAVLTHILGKPESNCS